MILAKGTVEYVERDNVHAHVWFEDGQYVSFKINEFKHSRAIMPGTDIVIEINPDGSVEELYLLPSSTG